MTKLLLSGAPNSGKTSLLQSLENVLVIARDGKRYPFPQPHVNVPDFTLAQEVIDLIVDKINAYEEKMGKLPETIAIDSVSKLFLDIEGSCIARINSFPYGEVNKEIKLLVDFIERDLADAFNVVMVSHTMTDEEGTKLVNAGGSFGKKGGILSEVDQAIYLDVRGKKRTIHYRNNKLVSRTTLDTLPDSVSLEDFNLQEHIDLLNSTNASVAEWAI